MRNILAKLSRGVQGEIKKQNHRVFRAEILEQRLTHGQKLVADYRDRYPNAMACLAKSLAECITCLKLPESHRRRVRTTNTLERRIEEARRRTKVVGPMASERSDLSLIHAVLVDVSKRWRGIKLTPGDLEKLNALRGEITPSAAAG